MVSTACPRGAVSAAARRESRPPSMSSGSYDLKGGLVVDIIRSGFQERGARGKSRRKRSDRAPANTAEYTLQGRANKIEVRPCLSASAKTGPESWTPARRSASSVKRQLNSKRDMAKQGHVQPAKPLGEPQACRTCVFPLLGLAKTFWGAKYGSQVASLRTFF